MLIKINYAEISKYIKHFNKICKHKYYVGKILVKAGLYWQAIVHDMSKFSPVEFISSARYFDGNKSPIEVEKSKSGYSLAWLHHKGCNKHHWQYWMDYKNGEVVISDIPTRYLQEMAADIVGASKAYLQDKYDPEEPLKYFTEHQSDWRIPIKDKGKIMSYIKKFSKY